MTEQELEYLFPNDFGSHPKKENTNQIITRDNYSSLCQIANQQFGFLVSHKEKSGQYFVDWRLEFWDLNEFLISEKDFELNIDIECFKLNFENSGDIMYERFHDEDKRNEVDKNINYGSWVDYIPALQIDGIINLREDLLFPEYYTDIKDSIFDTIPNAKFIKEKAVDSTEMQVHFIYPLIDRKMADELKEINVNTEIEDYCFNDLFNFLNIQTNQDFSLLVLLYNKIYNTRLVDIMLNPIIDSNPFINQILSISNGYLIFHHQLESIVKHLFKVSDDTAIEMRRNWNKKLIQKINPWREVEFDTNRTLYDLIISKAILKTEYPPLITYSPFILFNDLL